MQTGRIEIDLQKIEHNSRILSRRYASRGVRITAVTKGVCGDPAIAKALVQGGIHSLGESRLANIRRMRQAGISAEYVLIRPPSPRQARHVVALADVSLNTEIETIKHLSNWSRRLGCKHGIILMVELGDLREGIMPEQLDDVVASVLALEGLELVGIGTNLACLNGIIPTAAKMDQLTRIARHIEAEYGISLRTVSGGNSANHEWLLNCENTGRVNHLRVGEALLLGRETVHRRAISGLATDAFRIFGDVVEVSTKPSKPSGKVGQDAFGHVPEVHDCGPMRRAIVALGAQDVDPDALVSLDDARILGASSDVIVLHDRSGTLRVGSRASFAVGYGALLRAMTSPYVAKTQKSTVATRPYSLGRPAEHDRSSTPVTNQEPEAVVQSIPLGNAWPCSRSTRGFNAFTDPPM